MKMCLIAGAILLAAVSGSAFAAEGAAADHGTAPVKQEIKVRQVSPAYWRVTLHNPPFNIFGPETIPQLNEVITAIEKDPDLRVVVFDSDVPGFFLTHYDFVPALEKTTSLPPGPTGLPPLPDMLVRLSKAPVVSIVSIRGRATGVGSELSLASDMRFASREKAILSQWEVGAALVPGGGPMARLPRLMGRGRALEILLTGDDINGDIAERYGYVNRSLPDAELDGSWTRSRGASPGSTNRPLPTSSSWSTAPRCHPTTRSARDGQPSSRRYSARRHRRRSGS